MWRWRMDTSHEDGRQQGKHLSDLPLILQGEKNKKNEIIYN